MVPLREAEQTGTGPDSAGVCVCVCACVCVGVGGWVDVYIEHCVSETQQGGVHLER